MKERILSLDLARGFTVLFIAPVHVMLLYSKPSIHESWLGICFRFIAEGPGAQLFMLLMGISFYLSPGKKTITVLQKAFIILLLAYLLNIIKFVLPAYFGLVPAAMLQELQPGSKTINYRELLLIGDILHFASLALVIMLMISKLKEPVAFLLAAIIICFVSPVFWDMSSNQAFADHLLRLAGGQPPRVFFPLFPWLVYPLTGVFIGYMIKRGVVVSKLFVPGAILIATGMLFIHFSIVSSESFYRTGPAATVVHTGIVLAWLAVWHWIAKWLRQNWFFDLLVYLSKNITAIYFIQWMVIFWLLPVVGYQTMDMVRTVIMILFVTISTFCICYFIRLPR